MTDQERSEARFQRQLADFSERPRTGSWLRLGLLVSAIAWAVWTAGQVSETFRAWLM